MPDYYFTELQPKDFLRISRMVKDTAGINLHAGKLELVKARLGRRLRALGLNSYAEYLERVQQDASGQEFTVMLDAISTNVTDFFREAGHFDYLVKVCLPRALERKPGLRLHIWSAGCSSGEEPYSIAITMRENLPPAALGNTKILATDLSTRILEAAREGVYEKQKLKNVSNGMLARYFVPEPDGRKRFYRIAPDIRRMVVFSRLNLMDSWPMHGPFEVIFCRNVMIYFDRPTREQLVERYYQLLADGGTLFIGHSESFSGIKHKFRYIQPTIYQKS